MAILLFENNVVLIKISTGGLTSDYISFTVEGSLMWFERLDARYWRLWSRSTSASSLDALSMHPHT